MKDKYNKALLDLVVKTANDLGKHHADTTLGLVSDEMDSRFIAHGKNVDDVVELVADIDKNQNEFELEIKEVLLQLSGIEQSCKDFTLSVASEASESFDNVRVDIDGLNDALVELSLIVDSNENINALASGLKELTEKRDKTDVLNSDTFEKVATDLVKLHESICHIADDVAGNDEALIERIGNVDKTLTSAIDSFDVAISSVKSESDKSIQNILQDMVSANEKLSNLKSNIAVCGEDISTLSNETNVKLDILRDNDVEIKESISGIENSISASSDIITGLSESIAKSNSDIVKCDKKLEDLSSDFDTANANANELVNEITKSLEAYSDDLTNLAESNSAMLKDIDDITTALSEQFSELKNESFLSSDKIDTKFAEIKLSLVESDITRTESLKDIVQKHATDIQKELDDNFKEYRRNIGNQVEASNKLVVDNVDKMLSADKQMLNRAKQWESGVEYGQSVIVRNLAGIWQSRCPTTDEPTADSNDWYCISSGIHKATTLKDHLNGVETIIGIHDSLGNIHELTIPVATIRYLKGVYQEFVEYDHLDSIMKDGCRWVATKDNPQGEPGSDDADWQVLTMRGPKGMKGATGERGPKGKIGDKGATGDKGDTGATPEMSTIIKALVDFESPDGSQAIRRARGHWKLGNKYQPGDVANVGRGLFLALRNNDGTETPGSSTEDWLLLIEASAGGSPGALGTIDKLYMTESPLLEPPVPGVLEHNDGHLYFTDGQRVALVGSDGIKIDTSTVVNTVVETTIYSNLFAANSLHSDMRVLASISGAFSTDSASESLTLQFKLNGVAVHTIIVTPANGTDIAWRAIHEGTIRIAGASGKYIDFSEFSESGVMPIFSASPTLFDIDTTQTTLYEITATWGAAKAGNSFTCTQGDLTYKH